MELDTIEGIEGTEASRDDVRGRGRDLLLVILRGGDTTTKTTGGITETETEIVIGTIGGSRGTTIDENGGGVGVENETIPRSGGGSIETCCPFLTLRVGAQGDRMARVPTSRVVRNCRSSFEDSLEPRQHLWVGRFCYMHVVIELQMMTRDWRSSEWSIKDERVGGVGETLIRCLKSGQACIRGECEDPVRLFAVIKLSRGQSE